MDCTEEVLAPRWVPAIVRSPKKTAVDELNAVARRQSEEEQQRQARGGGGALFAVTAEPRSLPLSLSHFIFFVDAKVQKCILSLKMT